MNDHGPSLEETAPELIAALKALGDTYGPSGVSRTARQLVHRREQRHLMTIEQQQELAQFVNRNSLENGCDMPDFAIAAYLAQCYQALCIAAESKVTWPPPAFAPKCTCLTDPTISHYCGIHGDPTNPGGDCK